MGGRRVQGGRRPWLVLLALGLLVLSAACGVAAGTPRVTGPAGTSPRGAHPSTTAAASPTTTNPPATSTTDPGLLSQTDDEPSVGAALQAQMTTLWQAIVAGSEPAALPLFFPRSAYLQMKTGVIPDPAQDYASRLLGFYGLDIAAYHQLLGTDDVARLVAVNADPSAAAWIGPGQCENSIGYWHLPGVRLVYQIGANQYSFAVASLISWRGVWYVVHLGPNPRPTDAGTVDDPETGPGTPGPPGGC